MKLSINLQALESDPGMVLGTGGSEGQADGGGQILIMLEGLDEAEGESPLDNKVQNAGLPIVQRMLLLRRGFRSP